MKKVCYITGTRADYGLMRRTLQAIHCHRELDLTLLVTGMHLLPDYGETWKEIASDSLPIFAKVDVDLNGSTGYDMSVALGQQIVGFTRELEKLKPDCVLLLGDRGEMLAGAIAAVHLNIPVVHIHGGELSGTVDESVRHAITKLSHYHLTSTEKSRERLIRMGELADNIVVTGAPGLDDIYHTDLVDKKLLFSKYGLCKESPLLLVLFHPVVQQADRAKEQMQAVLNAALKREMQCLIIRPNADAGGAAISSVIDDYSRLKAVTVALHVPRPDFLSLMAHAEVMLGNSSSGIIEATSVNTPAVNVGDRQRCRERNLNIVDVEPLESEIIDGLIKAEKMKGMKWSNIYGDGNAADRIASFLAGISLDKNVLEKLNAY